MKFEVHVHLHNSHEDEVIALLRQVLHQGEQIMSKIAEFVQKQTDFNNAMDTAITGISGDIDGLNAKIAELQASAGDVTPEDQALLDQLTAQGQALADRVKAVDDLTPPTPPVVP